MAIKAGLVGVNPKGVDKNGMPIGSAGADVEAEIRQINLDIAQLQTSKVGIGQLTANNHSFNFAYDSTSEKYGYKLDGTGDFYPFEQAGAGSPGWNKPAELITTGLHYNNCTYEDGGYYVDGNFLYVDIVVKVTGNNASVYGFPAYDESYAGSSYAQCCNYGALPEEFEYIDRAHDSAFGVSGLGNQVTASAPSGYYKHIWGCMKLA